MCSRFEIDIPWDDIVRCFGIDDPPPGLTHGDIRPTDTALVISAEGDARTARWGLPASWDDKPLINARAETLAEKNTFRPLLESRCLVPASAYFEWRKAGNNRLKNRISLKDGGPMAFAGLLSGEYFTIITCSPNPSIAHIHNRMPVILGRGAQHEWCDAANPFSAVSQCLRPFSDAPLLASEDIPPQSDLFI